VGSADAILLPSLHSIRRAAGAPRANRRCAAFAPASQAAGAGNELKLVVGSGSGVDAIARVMAERVRTSSGHPVIVENRPGAGNETSASRRGPQPESILATNPIYVTRLSPTIAKTAKSEIGGLDHGHM